VVGRRLAVCRQDGEWAQGAVCAFDVATARHKVPSPRAPTCKRGSWLTAASRLSHGKACHFQQPMEQRPCHCARECSLRR